MSSIGNPMSPSSPARDRVPVRCPAWGQICALRAGAGRPATRALRGAAGSGGQGSQPGSRSCVSRDPLARLLGLLREAYRPPEACWCRWRGLAAGVARALGAAAGRVICGRYGRTPAKARALELRPRTPASRFRALVCYPRSKKSGALPRWRQHPSGCLRSGGRAPTCPDKRKRRSGRARARARAPLAASGSMTLAPRSPAHLRRRVEFCGSPCHIPMHERRGLDAWSSAFGQGGIL